MISALLILAVYETPISTGAFSPSILVQGEAVKVEKLHELGSSQNCTLIIKQGTQGGTQEDSSNVISSCFVFCELIVCVVCAYADQVPQLRKRGWRS